MPYDWKTELPGIYARHADDCSRREGGVCICGPIGYRAAFTDPSTGRRILSPDFGGVADAQAWLSGHQAAARVATQPQFGAQQIGAVIKDFLEAAEQGRTVRRPGEPYASESLHELRGALSYVDYELRAMDIRDVRRRHVQTLVDDLRSAGLPPARVLSVVDALRSLYAFAIQRDLVDFSPVVELELPVDGFVGQERTAPGFQADPPPQAPPYTPGWDNREAPGWNNREAPGSDDRADGKRKETLTPTAAMAALGGQVLTWTTRIVVIAFILIVIAVGRELGVTDGIPFL
jgi:hypothetical protein